MDFIPIVENSGFIIEIDRWVLKEVCKSIKEWQNSGFEVVPISINLSRVELYQGDFIDFIRDTINEFKVPIELIEVELTESTALNDIKFISEKIKAIRNLGIKVSIDDFGTGNSSLSNLLEIPVNTLKVDRSLVKDIHTNIRTKK